MYNKEFYPDYLSGTAYLMNLNAAKLLYRTSLTTPIFHLEDVYLTGLVADRAKLRRYHHPLFFYSTIKDLCSLRGMISQHQLQPSELRNAYEFVNNRTAVCTAPDRNFSMAKMKLQQRKKCHWHGVKRVATVGASNKKKLASGLMRGWVSHCSKSSLSLTICFVVRWPSSLPNASPSLFI